MKNIHLIPTDKPSSLSILNSGKLNFGAEFISSSNSKAQNIYITNSEEIKEGDYFIALDGSNDIYKTNKVWLDIIKENPNPSQKIILTTDQDLIKDGVQAIDDEFLEWFVKNSSCEEVGVVIMNEGYDKSEDVPYQECYKIIIPKEEPKQENCCTPIGQIKRYINCVGCDQKPKQETLGYICPQTKKQCDDECCVSAKDCHLEASMGVLSEPKQETLEEAADRLAYDSTEENKGFPSIKKFIQGTKWQAERMYSEEEVLKLLLDSEEYTSRFNGRTDLKYWFEQFKKK